ncbi:MAG: metal-dependent transcriptional regulator [Eubacteriales bacterium]|nr:metal-dependent transcriptional regulator [Eubacteriales bacterium]
MLNESGEMYLETILILSKEKEKVRSLDIANYMNFSKASISRAMSLLKNNNYIIIAKDGSIILTKKGKNIASKIYERHIVLSTLLCQIGIDKKTATADACKIEHVISNKSFNAIKKMIRGN